MSLGGDGDLRTTTPERRAALVGQVVRFHTNNHLGGGPCPSGGSCDFAQGILDLVSEFERVQTEWSAYEKRAAAQAERMIDERRDAAKRAEEAKRELEALRAERCYICRPGVAGVNEEGCSDCDEKAGLHAEIGYLRGALTRLKEELEP